MKRLLVLILLPMALAAQTETVVRGDLKLEKGLYIRSTLVNVTGNISSLASTTSYVRLTGDPGSPFNLTGIAGGTDGKFVLVHNATLQTMNVVPGSGIAGDSTVAIYSGRLAIFIYSSSSSTWGLAGGGGGGGTGSAAWDRQMILDSLNTDMVTLDSTLVLPAGLRVGQFGTAVGYISFGSTLNSNRCILIGTSYTGGDTLYLPRGKDTVQTVKKLGNHAFVDNPSGTQQLVAWNGSVYLPMSTLGFTYPFLIQVTDTTLPALTIRQSVQSDAPIFTVLSGTDTALVVERDTLFVGTPMMYFYGDNADRIMTIGFRGGDGIYKFKGTIQQDTDNVATEPFVATLVQSTVASAVDSLLDTLDIEQLKDVTLTDPVHGDVLSYDTENSDPPQWVNGPVLLMGKPTDNTGIDNLPVGVPVWDSTSGTFTMWEMEEYTPPASGDYPLRGNADSVYVARDTVCLVIPFSDDTTTITTGTGKLGKFPAPYDFKPVRAFATLGTAGASSNTVLDIYANGATIISASGKVKIAPDSTTSKNFGTQPTFLTNTITALSPITVNVDTVGTGARNGWILLYGYRP